MPMAITDDELQASLVLHSSVFKHLYTLAASLPTISPSIRVNLRIHAVEAMKCFLIAEDERRFGFFGRRAFRRIRKQIEDALTEVGMLQEVTSNAIEDLDDCPAEHVMLLAGWGRRALEASPTLEPQRIIQYSALLVAQETEI